MSGAKATTAPTPPAAIANESGILAPPETRVPALTATPKVGEVFTLNVGSNVTMELMGIPPGEFMLGSTKEEQAWAVANGMKEEFTKCEGETPRKTRVKQGFWLGRTEVTVGQWKQFVAATGYVTDGEKNGSSYVHQGRGKPFAPMKGKSWRDPNFGFELQDDHPVSCISWNDSAAFCEWLTELEQKAGHLPAGSKIRLPTEAEWEYACRAGMQTKFWWGEKMEDGQGRLNWIGTDDGYEYVAPVNSYGDRGRNRFCLADMLGNIIERCLDEYDAKQPHEECYQGNPGTGVSRGASFNFRSAACRCAHRNGGSLIASSCDCGFRVAIGFGPGAGENTATKLSASSAMTPASGTPALPASATNSLTVQPVEDAFAKAVAAQPLAQQLTMVLAKLRELNPQFDGKEQHKIEGGQVTELSFSTVAVKDISPLRALKGLKKLTLLPWTQGAKGTLSDLSPLQGLPLTFLACGNTQVSDLAPLKNMPLTILSVDGTQASDLSPLEGMPLTILWCDKSKVTNLSPLARVSGPLKELRCDFVPERDAAVLRGIKTLEKINNMPAAMFWAKVGPAAAGSATPAKSAAAGKVDPVYAARLTPQTRAAAVQRLGGTQTGEAAVTRALEWFKTSQNSEGSWGKQYKTSMTGFALLAYLAHGETEASQLYGEAVSKSIKWLLNIGQQSRAGTLANVHPEYQHPIAASALCEAYALTQNAALLPALEKAIALIVKSQCSNGSWDYGYNTKERNSTSRPGGDTSISSWNIQALKAAQRAGVKAPGLDACMSKALDFLRDVYNPKTGGFGYSTRGSGSPALLWAGTYCMHLLGAGDSKEVRGATREGSSRIRCDWSKAAESSTYEWYYATSATFHAGGSHWTSWNREFRDEIVKRQSADGSWPVPGSSAKEPPKSTRGFVQVSDAQDAAVYHTTVMTLMLESYYRYALPAR